MRNDGDRSGTGDGRRDSYGLERPLSRQKTPDRNRQPTPTLGLPLVYNQVSVEDKEVYFSLSLVVFCQRGSEERLSLEHYNALCKRRSSACLTRCTSDARRPSPLPHQVCPERTRARFVRPARPPASAPSDSRGDAAGLPRAAGLQRRSDALRARSRRAGGAGGHAGQPAAAPGRARGALVAHSPGEQAAARVGLLPDAAHQQTAAAGPAADALRTRPRGLR